MIEYIDSFIDWFNGLNLYKDEYRKREILII